MGMLLMSFNKDIGWKRIWTFEICLCWILNGKDETRGKRSVEVVKVVTKPSTLRGFTRQMKKTVFQYDWFHCICATRIANIG